jgi:hypothetical protein
MRFASPGGRSHLGLELLIFFLLLVAVLFNFLLSLSLGVPYPLSAICNEEFGQAARARYRRVSISYILGL